MKKPLSLRRILSYENPEIVAKFCLDLNVSKKVGETVFKDLLRYLYLGPRLCQISQRKTKKNENLPTFALNITDEMLIIDEMWHVFVLYTQEYVAFGDTYFGHYVHHVPTPTTVRQVPVGELKKSARERYRARLAVYMEFICDELGEDVLKRWFVTYPRKFSKEQIHHLKCQASKNGL
jgi:hypothetical protein